MRPHVGDDGLYDVRFDYQPADFRTVVTFSDGGESVFVYDASGAITRIVDPYGGAKERVVDGDGHVVQEIDAGGTATTLLYTDTGAHYARLHPLGVFQPPRSVEPHPRSPREKSLPDTPLEREWGGRPAVVPGTRTELPRELADRFGPEFSLESTSSPPLVQTDAMGRMVRRVGPGREVREWQRDAEGNVVASMDASGAVRRYEITSWNLRRRIVDPLGHAIDFEYSPREEVTRVVDAAGNETRYVYDLKDRLVEVWRSGSMRESYRYDLADNLVEKCDGAGRSLLTFEVGPANLKASRALPTGESHTFAYDARGRCVAATSSAGEVELGYDPSGWRTRDTRDGRGLEREVRAGQVAVTRLLGSFVTTQHWNGAAEPGSRIRRAERTRSGPVGTRSSAAWPTGPRSSPGTTSAVVACSRPPRGAWTTGAGSGGMRTPPPATSWRPGTKGPARRATSTTPPAAWWGARHPMAAGSRSPTTAPATSCSSRASTGSSCFPATGWARPTGAASSTTSGIRWPAAWVAPARCVSSTTRSTCWCAARSASGRGPRRTTPCAGGSASPGRARTPSSSGTASGWRRRSIRRVGSGSTCTRTRAPSSPCCSSTTTPPRRPRNPAAATTSSRTRWGRPSASRTTTRAPWQARMDPYGAVQVAPGAEVDVPLRFPGHYHDAETGLFYNRFRYYSPELGRYLQSDPLGLAGGYNVYAYPANPLTSVDLQGLHPDQESKNEGEGDDDAETSPRPNEFDDEEVTKPGIQILIEKVNGGSIHLVGDEEFRNAAKADLERIAAHPSGRALLADIQANHEANGTHISIGMGPASNPTCGHSTQSQIQDDGTPGTPTSSHVSYTPQNMDPDANPSAQPPPTPWPSTS